MDKKTIPKYVENNFFIDDYNNSYEEEVKEKIYNKLEKFKLNDIIKLDITQTIYNKYFYNIELMNEEKKLIDTVLE